MGVRIQELPETTGIKKEDVLIVEDGQGTKKGTVQQLYETLGVSQLKEDLGDIVQNGKYKSRKYYNFHHGTIDSSGNESTSDTDYITDYIPVTMGDVIELSNGKSVMRFRCYTSDKVFSNDEGFISGTSYTISKPTTAYVRPLIGADSYTDGCSAVITSTKNLCDDELKYDSVLPVQNKVIKAKFDSIVNLGVYELRPEIKQGYTVDNTGTEVESQNNFVTDFVEIFSENTYKLSESSVDFIARYYDSGKNYINRYIGTEWIPDDKRAKYCRFTGTLSKVTDISSLYVIESVPTEKCRQAINQNVTHNFIVVAKNGGDYATLTDAIKACSDGDTIVLMPGVYEEIISDFNLYNKQYHLVGLDRNSCIIRANSGVYADSPLCFRGYSIENLTIENINANGEDASNGLSYALHLDFGQSGDEVHIRNCTFRSDWFASVGIGTRKDCNYVFENCEFIENSGNNTGSVFFHNCQKPAYYGNNQRLSFINCTFTSVKHNLMVQSWNPKTAGQEYEGADDTLDVTFVNCNLWSTSGENVESTVFIQKGSYAWTDYIKFTKRCYGNNIPALNS